MPNHVVEGNKKPKEFTLISKTNKLQRFYTSEIEENLREIQILDQEMAKALIPFLKTIVKKFVLHRNEWFQLVNILSQIDAYCALALNADRMQQQAGKKFCLPEISSVKGKFELRNMIHPCLD